MKHFIHLFYVIFILRLQFCAQLRKKQPHRERAFLGVLAMFLQGSRLPLTSRKSTN